MQYRGFLAGIGLSLLCISQNAMAAYQEKYVPQRHEGKQVIDAVDTTAEPALADSATGTTLEESSDVIKLDTSTQMTRAEFTALVVEKLYSQTDLDSCFWDIASSVPPTFSLVFSDVHVNDRYAKHICLAMRDGLANGYSDGSFRPEKIINFAESAKILSRAFVLAPYAEQDRLQPWYRAHVQAVDARNAIPLSIARIDQLVTPRDAAEMIVRLSEGITWLPTRRYNDLLPKPVKQAVKPKPVSGSTPAKKTPATSSASSVPQAASSQSSSTGGFWDRF